MNFRRLLNGWQNWLEKSEVIEKIAKDRAKICAECPLAKEGMLSAMIGDKLADIQGLYCSKCICPLSAKIRSENEKCPIGKW